MESETQSDSSKVQSESEALWSVKDLSRYFGRSTVSIYADIKAGRLDPGILITPRCRRWVPSAVKVQQGRRA